MNIENKRELTTYLKQNGYLSPMENPKVDILLGGVSNRTVWLEKEDGTAWVLKQALEKLRVKADWFSHPRRIVLEALGIEWLSKLCPVGSIPKLIFLDKSQYVLAMEAILKPHENFKTLLLSGNHTTTYFQQFGQLLGTIHAQAKQHHQAIANTFTDYSFFETLRLEPYYEYTAQNLPAATAFLNDLCQACRSNRYTLVHGDYSPKNILVYQEKLILLDHEVVHFGDGTFDIGFGLTHFLSKANHLADCRAEMIQGAQFFWQAYLKVNQKNWSVKKETRAISHTLACLLARVHGRSPLEYLNQKEKERQTQIALSLIANRPSTLTNLIQQFNQNLLND